MNTETKHGLWRIGLAAGATLVFLLAIAAGLGMLASAAPAASPIYVRKDGDNVNCNGTANAPYPGGGPGLPCAVKTIQTGIGFVDPGGTVIVADGVYGENVDITKNLTLQGAGTGSTTIDAGGSGRGIHVDASVDTTVSGFTIRNGSASGGAGIYVTGSSVFTLTGSTVSNNTCSGCEGAGLFLGGGTTAFISGCAFVNNTGSGDGGAIFSSESTLTIVGSTFTGNEAIYSGGAIYNTGASGSLTVIESTFSNNAVTIQAGGQALGGGIGHFQGTLVISNTTIISNTTSWAGGGVSLNLGTARIVGSAIAGNSGNNTTSCRGGGIYNSNGTLTIEDSVVRDNWVSATSSSQGGGIFSGGRTTLNRVTVSGNSSTGYAGGIHSQDALTMTNVTLSGNTAFYIGGLSQTGGAAGTLVNCTIVNNTANSFGGGIRVYSTVNMANTLLANNENGNCSLSGGTINSGGHNLEDSDSCNLGAAGDITNADPHLFPLADFGGPSVGAPGAKEQMRLHAFTRSSPALDAGDDVACPAVDQRGVSRPVDGDGDSTATCDISAFEFDGLDTIFLPLVLRGY